MKFLLVLLTFICVACTPKVVVTEDNAEFQKAYALYRDAEYTSAIEAFEQFISSFSWSSKVDNAWYYRGKSAAVLADSLSDASWYEIANESFHMVPEKSSLYVDSRYNLGKIAYEQDDFDSAINQLEELYNLYPQHDLAKWFCYYISLSYESLGDSNNQDLWSDRYDSYRAGGN